ncbi:hypothetical protein Bbelb_321170 [Branchiostoma belcheri]|nr:hypothetical protein Bbelb_321170 [Branchiostoma belcheri]
MKTAMVALFAGLVIAVALLSSAEARSLSRRPPRVNLRDCPLLCPAVYSPVCGSNGQVYSNLCHLNVAKCLTAELEGAVLIEARLRTYDDKTPWNLYLTYLIE